MMIVTSYTVTVISFSVFLFIKLILQYNYFGESSIQLQKFSKLITNCEPDILTKKKYSNT